ncbi:MAG: hypothetical protein ACE5G0_13370 [Rhodothermales bacterium]
MIGLDNRHRSRATPGAFYYISFVTALLLLVSTPTLSGCDSGGSDEEDKASVCDQLAISSGEPTINFKQACSGFFEANITNIQYDNFSRVISFNFDISCSSTSEHYTGRAFNIVRNNVGQATAFDATVNGVNCHYP